MHYYTWEDYCMDEIRDREEWVRRWQAEYDDDLDAYYDEIIDAMVAADINPFYGELGVQS